MADYNRFVSYIYLYENGEKTLNAGFAKVESRNNQCRINISMKNMYHDNNVTFKAYMFVRKNSRLLGIYIGDINTNNSNGEFNGVTGVTNIENSGYCLDDISGLIIVGENDKSYGTRWDDDDLIISQFIPLEAYDASMGESEKKIGSGMVETESIPQEEPLFPESLPEEPIQAESLQAELLPAEEAVEEEEPKELMPEREEDVCMAIDGMVVEEPKSEPMDEFKQELESEPEQQAEPEGQLESEKEQEPAFESESGPVPDFKTYRNRRIERRTMARPVTSWQKTMEKVIDNGLRMYPFEDNDVEECVRLEPQDIGMLPMQCWIYGNNSFLLHGYYSYRHLILAKMQNGEYILGVPGINHNRDSFMAHMFGFQSFKSVRVHPSDTCEFGYWYVVLRQ